MEEKKREYIFLRATREQMDSEKNQRKRREEKGNKDNGSNTGMCHFGRLQPGSAAKGEKAGPVCGNQ